jgi:hypothetical protein
MKALFKYQDDLMPEGWDSEVTPLLMQGFTIQRVALLPLPFLTDSKLFKITQDRGVVVGLDYVAFNLLMMSNFVIEDEWNDCLVSLKGGGQDLLVNCLLERYDYSLDLGEDEEQLIHTRFTGGQTLESKLVIAAASLSTSPNISAQLIAYYSTKRLEEWKKTLTFPAGTGLKRQDFSFDIPATLDLSFADTGELTKNQGPIIGVSILCQSAEIFNWNVSLETNGIKIVDSVNGTRFSRLSQREPFILYYPFQAGSRFKWTIDIIAAIGANPGKITLTFYFAN